MTWRVSKDSPVAGVYTIGPKLVRLKLEEAFEDDPPFDTLAAHLHVHPNDLLASLCQLPSKNALAASRLHAQFAILARLRGADVIGPNQGKMMDALRSDALENPQELVHDLTRRAENTSWHDAASRDAAFPNWRVPIRGEVPATGQVRPLRLDVQLSDSLHDMLDLRAKSFDKIHQHLEDRHQDFLDLMEFSRRVRRESMLVQRYALQCRSKLKKIAPTLQQMMSLCTAVLATYTPPIPSQGPTIKNPQSRKKLLLLRIGLQAMLDVATAWILKESPSAKKRDIAVNHLSSALDNIDPSAAEALISWGDSAPSSVWYEYHGAMRACARAVACVPSGRGKTLIRKHFIPVFEAVLQQGSIDVPASKLEGDAAKRLHARASAFTGAELAVLGQGGRGAFSADIIPANFVDFLQSSLKPVERYKSTVETVKVLGPIVGLWMTEKNDNFDAAAMYVKLAFSLLPGPRPGTMAHDFQLHGIRLAVGALATKSGRGEMQRALKALHTAARSKPRVLDTSAGTILDSIELLLKIAEGFSLLGGPEGMKGSDWAKLAKIGVSVGKFASAGPIEHYAKILDEVGEVDVLRNMSGREAGRWIRSLSKASIFAVAHAATLWHVYSTAEEKRRLGDMSGKEDIQGAWLGVGVGLADHTIPGLGTTMSLMFSFSEVLAGVMGGPRRTHTTQYITEGWERMRVTLNTELGLKNISFEKLNPALAFQQGELLIDRAKALHWVITTGGYDKNTDKADGFDYVWTIAANEGRPEWHARKKLLRELGFGKDVTKWLLSR